MKRASKIPDSFRKSKFLFHGSSANPRTTPLKPYPQNPIRIFPTQNGFGFARSLSHPPPTSIHPPSSAFQGLVPMFVNRSGYEVHKKVSALKDEILGINGDSQAVVRVLDDMGLQIFRLYPDGSAFVELLRQLRLSPGLVFDVLDWRRKLTDTSLPMTAEEYSKGITMAGKAKNVKLATELFEEAANKRIKTASTYNALMGAYKVNGKTLKCQSLFQNLKKEAHCSPTIVTYNTLISAFSRVFLVDHMEATLEGIKNSNLTPTLKTYNHLIEGYLIASKWNDMENTYLDMKASFVKPDFETYLFMLRGYSHSGNLAKMEEVYELIKQSDSDRAKDINAVIPMICGYCKSSDLNKVKRIEELRKLIPKDRYMPWMNVLLIKAYAQEGLIVKMEDSINEAFEHQTLVVTPGVMRAIITAYFHQNAVDRLAEFVRRAENAGWRLCRSLYHCKMVMYANQNRLMEMENVLSEMDRVKLERNKKTLMILYKAYKEWGPSYRVYQVQGLLCKQGYEIPSDESPL